MIINLKSEEEIEGFKRAGAETSRILNILIKHIVPGWTGLDLDKIAREECEKINACPIFLNYRGFPASICVSKNNILVHGIPNSEPFRRGDIISIDFGLSMDGFIGDAAKTKIIDDLPKNFSDSKLLSECYFALFSALKVAKAGHRMSEIGRTIELIARQNNFHVPKEYGGHGISRNKLHDVPFIPNYYTPYDDFTLRAGMVLAIEPMFIDAPTDNLIVANDNWSVIAQGNTSHFENTILITENEPVILA